MDCGDLITWVLWHLKCLGAFELWLDYIVWHCECWYNVGQFLDIKWADSKVGFDGEISFALFLFA